MRELLFPAFVASLLLLPIVVCLLKEAMEFLDKSRRRP